MQRIRWSFALLATVLLVPLLMLLDRTLAGLERERDQRHQVVASRVFDETERTLSEFLEEERLRPPDHYFPVLRSGEASPLSRPPSREFVIDYFQIDAAGKIVTPRPERAALLGVRLLGLAGESSREDQESASPVPASSIDRISLERLEARVEKFVQSSKSAADLKKMKGRKEPSTVQRPGSTRAIQKIDLLERSEAIVYDDAADLDGIGQAFVDRADKTIAREQEKQEAYSSFEILERLNSAVRSRAGRLAEYSVARAPVQSLMRASSEPDGAMGMSSPPSPSPAASRALMASVAAPAEESIDSFAVAVPASSALAQRFAKAPMASLTVDDRHLILYRNTIIPGRGSYQQGLFLDLEKFSAWIEGRVVVETGLSRHVELDLMPIWELGADLPRRERRFLYDHRFGEPFEDLGARLALRSLPNDGASANIYLMGFLLITVSTVGLWAMYRRVAAAVHFAERRSNFAAAVSHELKTPLTAIRMYAEMLRDGMVADEAKRHEYYGTITSEAERLTRLINNVLEFSNLEKRNRKVVTKLAPIEPCLREVVQILSPHANSRGFTIALELGKGLPPVNYEADALQQILYNLIDNALKYAEDAEQKQIDVEAIAVDGGVRICVRDFGPGVSKEHRRHLFEPFYRGESELTRRTRGTGIGLALVKGLAEEMNAEIEARNASDGGFEVELRLRG